MVDLDGLGMYVLPAKAGIYVCWQFINIWREMAVTFVSTYGSQNQSNKATLTSNEVFKSMIKQY